jgi:hypothetical protein
VTAEGRGWIVAGKPAESETNGKTRFHLSSLFQIGSVYFWKFSDLLGCTLVSLQTVVKNPH